jgi:hypothetical protein
MGVASSVITNLIVGFYRPLSCPRVHSFVVPLAPLTEERYIYHLLKPRPPPDTSQKH